MSKKQVGGLIAVGVLAGPLAPALVGGLGANKVKEMKDERIAHKNSIEERIKENISLNDIESLTASITFLEEYAASLDSKLEIVSSDDDYYILPANH